MLHSEAQQATPDWDGCRERIAHPDMLGVLQKVTDGASFRGAFLECMGSPTGVLAAIFFGPMAAAVETDAPAATVHATDGLRRLYVTFAGPGTDIKTILPPVKSAEGTLPTRTVAVATDWNRYHFTHLFDVKHTVEPFVDVDIDELAADVALVGSVWSSVFPAHRAIVTRTVAVSVPRQERGILFDRRKGALRGLRTSLRSGIGREARREIRALDRLESTFCRRDGLQLSSLEDLRERFEASDDPVETLSERRTGDLVVRTYRPPRSRVVRFHPTSPANEPNRGDYVISYQPGGSRAEFHREFVICKEDWEPGEDELYRATFNILHVLAIRRSGLFRLGFAERVYTVLLPPALLEMDGRGDQGIFLVPCVILYQVPGKSSFRSTFTVSYVAIPVELDPVEAGEDPLSVPSRVRGPRFTAIDELRALRRDLTAQVVPDNGSAQLPLVTTHGPLAELLGVEGDFLALPTLLQQIGEFVSGRVIARERQTAASIAAAMTFTATVESTLSTLLLQVDWRPPPGAAQPWEDWLLTGKHRPFTDNVYKLMCWQSAQVGQIRTREDYYYEELRGSSLMVLL